VEQMTNYDAERTGNCSLNTDVKRMGNESASSLAFALQYKTWSEWRV